MYSESFLERFNLRLEKKYAPPPPPYVAARSFPVRGLWSRPAVHSGNTTPFPTLRLLRVRGRGASSAEPRVPSLDGRKAKDSFSLQFCGLY